MYKCEFCEREFVSKQAVSSHKGKCKNNPNYKGLTQKQKDCYSKSALYLKSQLEIDKACEYCGRHFKKQYALTSHLRYFCKSSDAYSLEENMLIRKQRAEKQSEQKRKYYKDHPELREKMSKHTVWNNFWEFRSKNPIVYKSQTAGVVHLDSKWELIVAKRLDDLGLKWFRPKTTLPYKDNEGIERQYHPDFYVEDYNCLIEVKSSFVRKLQNTTGKCDCIKSQYPFVVWLETESDCKNFVLEYSDVPLDIEPLLEKEYWIEKNREQEKAEADLLLAEEIQRQSELKLLMESNIDFSKFGWVKEASIVLGMSTSKVGNYIRKRFPELCLFLRKGKNSNEGKHWYTNGTDEISSAECPKGYRPGRLSSIIEDLNNG